MSGLRLSTIANAVIAAVIVGRPVQLANAITFDLTKQVGTSGLDSGEDIFVNASGIFVVGTTQGSLFGAGTDDAFIARYDLQGNLLWGRQFGTSTSESGYAVKADILGNAYIAGSIAGDAFIRKYDSSGNVVWTRQFGTIGSDWCRGIVVDELGGVFVSGAVEGDLGGVYFGRNDAFVRKYDAVGNLQWTRQFGTSDYDAAYAMATDGVGHLYVTGFSSGALGAANKGLSDAFVAKYDVEGNHLWTRQFGSIYYDYGYDIYADSIGSVYIVGQGYANQNNVLVAKYDAAGNQKWAKNFGTTSTDQGFGVTSDNSGSVYIVGRTEGVLGSSNAGAWDAFVSKYDVNGNSVWTEQFGTAYDDGAFGISTDGTGKLFVTGSTKGSLFGPNAGSDDVFVARFDDGDVVPPIEPPPGDYNKNFTVDAADYILWREPGLGNLVEPCSGADHNCNGVIDNQDYATWRSNFGRTTATGLSNDGYGGGIAAVPEPPTLLLAVIAVTFAVGRNSSSPRSMGLLGED